MAPTFSSTADLLSFSPIRIIHHRHRSPPVSKITMSISTHPQSYWSSLDSAITTHLFTSLPTSPPPAVTAPIRHLISAAPSTLAPALCLAACDLVGGHRAHAIDAACALRLMHAASFSHGQLPALLAARKRNPNPKPILYGEGVELLAADAILPLGYKMVARSGGGADPVRVLRVVLEIAEAMGAVGVAEAQARQAEGEEEDGRREGRMWACGAACGGFMGGGGEEEVERLRRFGLYAGMAHGLMMGGVDADSEERADGFRMLAEAELDGFRAEEAWGRADAVRRLSWICSKVATFATEISVGES